MSKTNPISHVHPVPFAGQLVVCFSPWRDVEFKGDEFAELPTGIWPRSVVESPVHSVTNQKWVEGLSRQAPESVQVVVVSSSCRGSDRATFRQAVIAVSCSRCPQRPRFDERGSVGVLNRAWTILSQGPVAGLTQPVDD